MGYPHQINRTSVGATHETYGIHRSGNDDDGYSYKIPNVIEAIELENTHATQTLYISMNGGRTFRTVEAGAVYSMDTYSEALKKGLLEEFEIYASGANTTCEITLLITEGR